MLTIAAVLGLAVIGTAGAFGYRAFTSGSGAPANPPVIKADTAPAKIVPPRGRSPTRRASRSRIASARLPPRRAGRFARRAAGRAADRRRARVARRQTGFAPAASAPLVPPQPPAAGANEPKRVKTMTIRPDSDPTSATPRLHSAAPPPAGGR